MPRFRRSLAHIKSGARSADDSRYPLYKVPSDGKPHKIRILPGWFGGEEDGSPVRRWYVEVYQHWVVNPKSDRGFKKSFFCKHKQSIRGQEINGFCGCCDLWTPLKDREQELKGLLQGMGRMEAGSYEKELKLVKAQVSDLNYRTTYLTQILDREDADKLKLFYIPKTAFDVILSQYMSQADEAADKIEDDVEMAEIMKILSKDPDNKEANETALAYCDAFDAIYGYDLDITRVTENNNTKYTAAIRRNACRALKDMERLRQVMDDRYDLEKIIEESMENELPEEIETCAQATIAASGKATVTSKTVDADTLTFDRPGRSRGQASQTESRTESRPRSREEDDDEIPGVRGREEFEPEGEEGDHEHSGVIAPEDAEYLDDVPAQPVRPLRPAPSSGRPPSSRPAPAVTKPSSEGPTSPARDRAKNFQW